MADYHALLTRAVSGLPDPTPESRRAIYERARKALLGQLGKMDPPVAREDIAREEAALDEAVARIEAERGDVAPPPPPTLAPPPILSAPASDVSAPRRPPPFIKPPGPRTAPSAARSPALERPTSRIGGVRPQAPIVTNSAPETLKPLDAQVSTAPAQTSENAVQESATLAQSEHPIVPASGETPESPAIDASFLNQFGRARVDEAAAASAGGFAPELTPASRDLLRPSAPAPAPPAAPRSGRLVLVIVASLALLAGGVAWLALKLRDNPEDFTRGRPQTAAEQQGPGKIAQRIGAAASGGTADQAETVMPVAQRAAFLVEAPDEPQGVRTYVGEAVWRAEGSGPAQTVRVDLNFGDAKFRVGMTIAKNLDPTLPASLTLELRFTPAPDSEFSGGVAKINMPQTRAQERPLGDTLIGVPLAITASLFRVSLTNDPVQAARNIESLRSRAWIDVPLQLTNGRLAKLTFEKGATGDRLVAQAIDAWR